MPANQSWRQEPQKCDAYVVNAKDEPMGMAIFVGGNVMVTCAHVVADALGDKQIHTEDDAPTAKLNIRFFRSGNETLSATVREDGWLKFLDKQEAGHVSDPGMSDIAVLELDRVPDEDTAQPLTFTDVPPSRWEDALRFYGYTRSKPQGGWVSARENGVVEKDRIELKTGGGDDNIIEGGCSGSMVWDQIHGRCVGMVDARLDRRTGYAIPVGCLVDACVEILPEPPENDSLVAHLRSAVMLIDRKEERNQMEEFLRNLRVESPVKPVLCVISGRMKSHPELLLTCFLNGSFPKILGSSQGYVNEAKEIELDSEPMAMQRSLAAIVCDDPNDIDPAAIAEQMRQRKETFVFTSEIYLEDLNEGLEEVLRDYIRFLENIAKQQPNTPLFHCFFVTTNAKNLESAQVNTATALFEECSPPKGGELHGPLAFGPLEKVQRRHLKDWIRKELEPLLKQHPQFDASALEYYMLAEMEAEFDMNDCILFVREKLHAVLGHA